MLLVDWLLHREISDAKFAEMIGKSRIDVFRYKKGEVMPRPEVVARIEEATGGAVRPVDLYAAYMAKRSSKGSK